METDQRNTNARIFQSAYSLFYRGGFTRVQVDSIAARANSTNRLVYFIQSKDDIVAAALEARHEHLLQQYQQWLGPETSNPVHMMDRLFAAFKKWTDGKHWLGSGYSRIATELADMSDRLVRRAAHSHKANIGNWLSDRLAAAGLANEPEVARQIMILTEGGMSLSLIHGDTSYIEAAQNAATCLVSQDEWNR